ncbi:metallophosphoesterase [Flavobacterium sp. RHBU_3]|uniref:metallophosphoesterase n=1 Tax=Flavobacterium sp. RHBU_3 TaxID=3391184 RepID=UPI0039846397
MKIFPVATRLSKNIGNTAVIATALVLASCAVKQEQYGKKALAAKDSTQVTAADTLAHSFYLVGDAGYADSPHSQQLLKVVGNKLKKEGKNTTLFYLGDNVYPLGVPKEGEKGRKEAEASLNSQLALAGLFKGKTYFIPGNHDWYHGLKGLQEQEKLVKEALGKKAFQPGSGCAINDIKVTDNITIITIDSQWYLEDWDNYPTINDDCDIKTREAFFLELESLLNKNQDKTILLAMHHPLMDNGAHGGQLEARKEIYPVKKVPLPIVGSLINLIRNTGGVIDQDLQSKEYRTLSDRIKTLLQPRNNVIVLSGHDHNLQYIEKDNIKQIISGAGSKEEGARAINDYDFSYGGRGYATLDVFTNGEAIVKYFKVTDNGEEEIFTKRLLHNEIEEGANPALYSRNFPKDTTASIYSKAETTKSGFYRFLFGEHYRKYYSTPVNVPVAVLDTLHGGFTVGRAGGGHQSNSIRLIDKQGHEYVMRAVRKSTTRFIQSSAFKTRYVGDEFENTYAERFLLDFYTTANPYTPFIINDLVGAVGIYHTNPELYYIPKQPAMGKYNTEYGDALFMVEERPSGEFSNTDTFGHAKDIISSDDVHDKLAKSKKNVIDEKMYIRARLFDLAVGDWDRHADQWRWAEFKTPDSTYYRPIPRDRDQAFPKIDGKLLSIIMTMPALRYMRNYTEEISSVRWQAKQGYPQDVAFITKSGEKEWLEQAAYIKEHLTNEVIDKAFAQLPPEIMDGDIETIKKNLKSRRDKLDKYALEYRKVLLRTVLLTGTDKKDRFEITRKPGGITQVELYSVSKKGDSLIYSNTYNRKETKELWIYGLDDDDVFNVKGKPEKPITLRLIGGQNHDNYIVENGKKVKIYDFKSKENTYEADSRTAMRLTDDYETNSYDYKKPNYNYWMGYPMIGYNPDDGVKLGASAGYTVNNFNRRPFSRKHTFAVNYFFATMGFEFKYKGVFMNVASKWNLGMDARYTSNNFSINYFGMGNETANHDNELGMDYNRVKLQVFRVSPSVFKQGVNGSAVELKTDFETVEVDGTTDRFVNQPGAIPNRLFEHLQYAGVQGTYKFENYDNASLPAMGLKFYATGGWKMSFDTFERNFAYGESSLTFWHRLTQNDKLVLSSGVKGKLIFNNNYEFYQASTLGGDADLRGYRRERFYGRNSFLHTTDLRYTLGKGKSIIPVTYGLLGGYDYGRVWLPGEHSNKWHQGAGGGFWLNGASLITANVSYFYGSDGGRVTFGMMMGL